MTDNASGRTRTVMEERSPWVWVADRGEWVAEASSLEWPIGQEPQSQACPECGRPVDRRRWQRIEELEDLYWQATCPGESCGAKLIALND